jgi:hypothetical protein
MRRLFGGLLFHTNSQSLPILAITLKEHGGGKGGTDKKLFEFFIHRVLKT